MHRIKNIKDPTLKWNYYAFISKLPAVTVIIVILLNVEFCQANDVNAVKVQRLKRREYISSGSGGGYGGAYGGAYGGDNSDIAGRFNTGRTEVIQNISCIAHDSKFTCDCHNTRQLSQLSYLRGYVKQIEISNCVNLIINANSFVDTQGMRRVSFQNIGNLVLKEFSLAFPRHASNTPIIVEFGNVTFETIDSHAINGNIEEISFVNCHINALHAYSFATLQDHGTLFKMDGVRIKQIEQQAFKKFAVEQMEITNCIFETNVPSKAFYELEVLESLRIYNVKFKEIHTHAFSFQKISSLSITNNNFEGLDAEWFVAHVLKNINIRMNNFGNVSQIAFAGLRVHRDYKSSERLELRFINNTLQFPNEPLPLEFNERFTLNIKHLYYNNKFSCHDLDNDNRKQLRPKKVFFQNQIDNVYFLSGSSKNNNQSYLVLSKLIESDCQQNSYWLYILIFCIIAFLLIVTIIIVVVVVQRAKKRKRRKMDVIMPEPRTYKETQIIYQIENAGLLKTDL